MKRFYGVYQYAAPLLLTPLAYLAWLVRFDGRHALAAACLAMPVIASYVVAGVGTNVLKLWAFDTRLKIGEIRPHHGFLLGSATSLLAWLCAGTGWSPLQQAFVTGSVVGFWNWLYDRHAVKSGFLIVRSRSSPDEYAPVFFGAFGAVYGAAACLLEQQVSLLGRDTLLWPLAITGCVATIALPTGAYVLASWLRYGDPGLRPVPTSRS
ncbi:MAG: hypothetical protein WC728_05625 [Elusimicrobiota bacterium]